MRAIFYIFILIGMKSFGQCPNPITYSLNVTPESCTNCCDGSIQIVGLNGGCPPYTMNLIPAGTFSSMVVSGLCAGNYTVVVTDNGCCPPNSQTCSIGSPTEVKEQLLNSSITLKPNPNNGHFILKGQREDIVFIRNGLGQNIQAIELNSYNNFTSEITIVQSGVYFVIGRCFIKKVVVLR